MVIKEAIHEVINGKDLSYEMAQGAMKEIMSGEASQVLMATYLTALRMKGETITEITASAQAMRDLGVHLAPDYDVLEIVGTGGDEVGTFNISTTSAFVIAAAGIPVAKHGNRSVSSKSGAADVLESLGADITIDDKKSKEVLDKAGKGTESGNGTTYGQFPLGKMPHRDRQSLERFPLSVAYERV